MCFLQMAMSPVFHKMFEADMLERKTHSVSIIDFAAPAVEEFLHFLYNLEGKSTAFMDTYAVEVWALADKYRVDCCKQYVPSACGSFVDDDNVVDLLKRAELHNASDIGIFCVEYFAMNAREIVNEKNKDIVTLSHTNLIDIVRAFLDKEEDEEEEDERLIVALSV